MKKLISKNPIKLFKIGKFQKGKPLNMSRLYRRSDGTYTTTDGTVVGYWKGKRLGISGLAWQYLANKYGKEYANNANANMVNGNIYQGGKWRADFKESGNKTVDWKTATEGQNTDTFADKRTGYKTRFNVSRNLSKPQQTTKKISNPLTKANLTPKTSSAPEKSKFLRGAEAGNYKILLNSNGNYYYDLGPYRIFANGDVYRLKTKELIDTKKGYRSEYIHRTMPLIATTRFGAKRYRDINGNIVDSDGDIVSTYEELKSNPYTVYKPKVGQITIDPEMGMAFYRNPTANSELYLNTPGLFTIYKQGGILKHQRGAKFMGTGVQKGWTSSYGNNLWNGITNDLKLALIGTGKFTEDSFKDARSLQTALNNYFAGNAATMNNQDTTASRIAVDNKWGDLSQKALIHALSMANYDEARPLNINNVSPINAPLNGISTIPTKAEARPEHIYNRAEVRQLLRNQGINPYSLSGALRQAIRFALNGGHQYNKALLQGIDLKKLTQPVTLKKSGGRLISKDPVKQFKQGGSIAKYGLGDRMKSYVKKKKSELNRAKAAANSWSGYELTYPVFTQNGIATKGVISGRNYLPEVTVTADKEGARKARLTEAGKRNASLAKMQDTLFRIGAYDRNKTLYRQAVDGLMGGLTRNAIKKAKEMGYEVNEKTGEIKKLNRKGLHQKTTDLVHNINEKMKSVKSPVENPRKNNFFDMLYTPGTTPPYVQKLMYNLNSDLRKVAKFLLDNGVSKELLINLNIPKKAMDRNGRPTQECAAFINATLKQNGIESWGDSFRIPNQFKKVINGYDFLKNSPKNDAGSITQWHKAASDSLANNLNISTLDPNHAYTVNMYYTDRSGRPSSHTVDFYNKAKESGSKYFGTHVGVLYHDLPSNTWRVTHNIGGNLHNEEFSEDLGSKSKYGYGIVGITDAGQIKKAPEIVYNPNGNQNSTPNEDDYKWYYKYVNPVKDLLGIKY